MLSRLYQAVSEATTASKQFQIWSLTLFAYLSNINIHMHIPVQTWLFISGERKLYYMQIIWTFLIFFPFSFELHLIFLFRDGLLSRLHLHSSQSHPRSLSRALSLGRPRLWWQKLVSDYELWRWQHSLNQCKKISTLTLGISTFSSRLHIHNQKMVLLFSPVESEIRVATIPGVRVTRSRQLHTFSGVGVTPFPKKLNPGGCMIPMIIVWFTW